MSYQKRLSHLRQNIRRITDEEYKRYVLNENMKVKELLNRILGRIWNSFNIEVLYEKEYKKEE